MKRFVKDDSVVQKAFVCYAVFRKMYIENAGLCNGDSKDTDWEKGRGKMMQIGQIIRKYRKRSDMTQEEMAERLGVSAPAVNKWENGVSHS